jgi:hypothetical protein
MGEAAVSHEELLCRLQSLAERAVRRYALPSLRTCFWHDAKMVPASK